MKRYRHEPNGGLVPHEEGRYVDADIAQELYDALKDALRSARKDFPLDQEGEKKFKVAYAEQFRALEKANRE